MRWGRSLLLAAGVVLLVLMAGGAGLQGYAARNQQFCTSRCHSALAGAQPLTGEQLNGAVVCQDCHSERGTRSRLIVRWALEQYEEVGGHTVSEDVDCQLCHEDDGAAWLDTGSEAGHAVHVGRADLSCLSCHHRDVHGYESGRDGCLRCHSVCRTNLRGMVGFPCDSCHRFRAPDRGLLPVRTDCLDCHAASDAERYVADAGDSVRGPDCIGCHDPHGRRPPATLDCATCHASLPADEVHGVTTGCEGCHHNHHWMTP